MPRTNYANEKQNVRSSIAVEQITKDYIVYIRYKVDIIVDERVVYAVVKYLGKFTRIKI